MLSKSLQKDLPDQKKIVLVGVSGGADSVALLHCLVDNGYQVIAAHFNHRLRADADQEVEFVERFAADLEIPFVSGEEEVSRCASENSLSIEEAARNQRYFFLFRTARAKNCDLVCTAHHADDQLETILMNLLRGTGTDGLTGMESSSCPNPWSDSIPLVRPFLSVRKEDIETYCQRYELSYISDPSNLDRKFFRNQIRHDVIPFLEKYSNGFQKKILQTADILRQESLVLEKLTDQAAHRAINQLDQNTVEIYRESFTGCSLGIQRRLIRKAFDLIRPEFNQLTFQNVEDAVNFCLEQINAGQQNWVARLNLISLEDRCLIADWKGKSWLKAYPQLDLLEKKTLPIPGSLELGYGWVMKAEETELENLKSRRFVRKPPDFHIYLDQNRIAEKLSVRTRQAGDRIQPLGMQEGSIKISDLMVNEKIPQQARDRWPILLDGDEIIWVPGLRLAEAVRVSEKTERVIQLILEKQLES